MTPVSGSTPAGTPLEDLGCPHCGKTCDVCFDTDAEVARLRAVVERVERYVTRCALLRMEPSTQGLRAAVTGEEHR